MVIMDIKADNLYSFKNFHLNMSYPKKIVDSTINQEYLEDRPNFRYRKVNIIMGECHRENFFREAFNAFFELFHRRNV